MPSEPTTPARRALAARAAGSESTAPTAAQLLAAEEARRAAVESEAQLADLLASEADRGDELSAEVARAGKAAARWERKYTALKEGVDALVSSVRDERARVRAEQAAMECNLANMSTLADTVTSERDSLASELEGIRASFCNPHEHSAVLDTDHIGRDHAAVREVGALSGTGDDARDEESNNDDDDRDESDGGSRGEESDGSAGSSEWLRDELINFANTGSATGAESHGAADTLPAPPESSACGRRPPASYYNDAG